MTRDDDDDNDNNNNNNNKLESYVNIQYIVLS